jgi:hypothetical protein
VKIVTVEVEVHLPDKMGDAAVAIGIDHMLDSGGAAMVDHVFECAAPHIIDSAIAQDCVELTVHDATVVKSLENQPEHPEPPQQLIHLTALEEYHDPFHLADDQGI